MDPNKTALLDRKMAEFKGFYESLVPSLVEFVGLLGINPSHQVLNHAPQFVSLLEKATQGMTVESKDDKVWFVARMGYFIGEVFVQKFGGCWYVNDSPDSKYFAHYVVGRFAREVKSNAMIDPFEISLAYVDSAQPRGLIALLGQIEAALRAA